MSHWFDILMRPDHLVRISDRRLSAEAATSVLLDGALGLYTHLASRFEWPSPDDAQHAPPPFKLPAALLLQLQGSADPEMFDAIALDETREPPERALAGALACAFHADAGTVAQGIDLLSRLISSPEIEGAGRAYLQTHLSLRYMETGDWDHASVSLASSVAMVSDVKAAGRESEARLMGALEAINARNEFHLRAMTSGKVQSSDGGYNTEHLFRVDTLTAEALERDVSLSFEGKFENPRRSSLRFQRYDETEQALWGALLRAETLADFEAINDARKNLGRYLLISSAGIKERSPDAGFLLLVRGGDAKGVAGAATAYLDRGPLHVIVRLGNQTVQRTWYPLELIPTLKLIALAADVLEPELVPPTLQRLCDSYDALIRPMALQWATSDVIEAMAALARVAPVDMQATAATFALMLAQSTSDGMALQALPTLVHAIRWADQPDDIVDRWIAFVRGAMSSQDDRRLVAESAMYALLPRRTEELFEFARLVLSGSQALAVAAASTGLLARLTEGEVADLSDTLVQSMQGTQEAAVRGSFSMGGGHDAAALFAMVLTQRLSGPSLWYRLMAFLSNADVSWTDKRRSLEVLLDHVDKVPSDVIDQMKAGFEAMTTVGKFASWLDDADGVDSVTLRAASALKAMTTEAILYELLRLAASGKASERIEAARAAAYVDVADDGVMLSLLLLLSRDSVPVVRAHASQALLMRSWDEQLRGLSLVWARVRELLSDSGRESILGGLQGLNQSRWSQLPPDILRQVEGLAARHPSWRVRILAEKVLVRFGVGPS
jgi:hypothetical protein